MADAVTEAPEATTEAPAELAQVKPAKTPRAKKVKAEETTEVKAENSEAIEEQKTDVAEVTAASNIVPEENAEENKGLTEGKAE